jgi:hypothetical protein
VATEIPVKITADTRQAERDIKRFEDRLNDLGDQAGDAAKALGVITAAAAAFSVVVARTIGAAGDIVDAAKAIGISASSLETLQTAAQLAGVSAENLNNSMIRLSSTIGEGLAKGSGPAVEALRALNLPIQEINRLKPDEQFKRITTELLAIQNPAERTALAMDLFGKQGPRILAVAQELEKVRQITEDIGFGITERELTALDEASDSVDQLRIIWDAGVKKAVAEVAPYIVAIVNRVKEAIVNAGGFEAIWQRITEILKSIVNILVIIATILVARVAVGAAQVAIQLIRAQGAARGMAAILARTPIGLLATGAAIIAEKLGVDIVGAAGDFLDLNLDIKGAQDQITNSLNESQSALNQTVESATRFTEEQKKAITALDQTIVKLEQQAQYQRDVIQYGEVEARIRRTVAEETEKLTKVGLTLNDQQRQRLENAIKEEEAAKRIVTAREKLAAAEGKFELPASREFNAAFKEIAEAYNAMRNAMATGNNELIRVENDRYIATIINYRATVIQYGLSLTERGRLDLQYAKDLGNVERAMLANKELNMGRETDLYRLLNDEKLRIAEEYNSKLEDIELKRIEKVLMAERSGMARQLSDSDRALLQKKGQDDRQQAIVRERIEFEKKSEFEKAQWAIQQGATVFSALGAQNKRAFEAAKAFNIAQALMNTYAGATKALATYPWPFGLIAAAAAVASGLAQVAMIRSQTYSGRALGGPVMNNTPYIVGESGPELFVPGTTGSIMRNGDLGGAKTVNVNFQITANDTTGFDQLLASRKGMITQIINDAVLERGKRSIA